jgi:hypothetical protein
MGNTLKCTDNLFFFLIYIACNQALREKGKVQGLSKKVEKSSASIYIKSN